MLQAEHLTIEMLVNAAVFLIVGMMWTAKMKKTLLASIAALLLATGAAHERAHCNGY
jgi:hypothetical protein